MARVLHRNPIMGQSDFDKQTDAEAEVKDEQHRKKAFALASMWYVLGPGVLIVLVIAFVAYVWMRGGDLDRDSAVPIGTSGDAYDPHKGHGGNPNPRHDTTEDELEYRGAPARGRGDK